MLEIYTILRIENHRDRDVEVMGAASCKSDADSMVATLIEADHRAASDRGYPNTTMNHYRIEGPFLVTNDGRSIFMQDFQK